jgi:hypothetical protein
MADGTVNDTQMTLASISPDGPVDGVPVWVKVSGSGTMLGDPSVWDVGNLFPDAHAAWDALPLPEGHKMFLVSDTLAPDVDGPLTTEYAVKADVDRGAGVVELTETFLLHVINRATTLGGSMTMPIGKP